MKPLYGNAAFMVILQFLSTPYLAAAQEDVLVDKPLAAITLTTLEEQEIIENLDLLEKGFLFDDQVDSPELLLQPDVQEQPTY